LNTLTAGETNRYYRLGAKATGTVTVIDYWGEQELEECRVKVSQTAHEKFGGKTLWVAASELVTWLRLAFPLTARDAGWDAGGNFEDPLHRSRGLHPRLTQPTRP